MNTPNTGLPQHHNLLIHPLAFMKFQGLCRVCSTEIGLYCVTHPQNPLYIIDFVAPRQICTGATFEFDPLGAPDIYDYMEAHQIPTERFNRIIAHTHPGASAEPSSTDWEAFREETRKSLGMWGMLILAKGGAMTAHLGFMVGEGLFEVTVTTKVLDSAKIEDFPGELSVENIRTNLAQVREPPARALVQQPYYNTRLPYQPTTPQETKGGSPKKATKKGRKNKKNRKLIQSQDEQGVYSLEVESFEEEDYPDYTHIQNTDFDTHPQTLVDAFHATPIITGGVETTQAQWKTIALYEGLSPSTDEYCERLAEDLIDFALDARALVRNFDQNPDSEIFDDILSWQTVRAYLTLNMGTQLIVDKLITTYVQDEASKAPTNTLLDTTNTRIITGGDHCAQHILLALKKRAAHLFQDLTTTC